MGNDGCITDKSEHAALATETSVSNIFYWSICYAAGLLFSTKIALFKSLHKIWIK